MSLNQRPPYSHLRNTVDVSAFMLKNGHPAELIFFQIWQRNPKEDTQGRSLKFRREKIHWTHGDQKAIIIQCIAEIYFYFKLYRESLLASKCQSSKLFVWLFIISYFKIVYSLIDYDCFYSHTFLTILKWLTGVNKRDKWGFIPMSTFAHACMFAEITHNYQLSVSSLH